MSLPRIAVLGVWCVLALMLSASETQAEAREQAQRRSGIGPRQRSVHARPMIVARRVRPIPVRVRSIPPLGYRSGYRPYIGRPGFRVGVRLGSPYRHYPFRYGHRYPYPYGVPYPYGYGYPYPGPFHVRPGGDFYGGVRFDVRERDAAIYVDGYYAGIADDFDGTFQRLELEPGPHRIEVRLPGYQTLAFDVNVRPGETIRYHGDFEQLVP